MTRARILVVDDERVMEPPLRRSLSMVGYQVHAEGCESALAHLDTWRPHLLFIDRSAPNRDGVDLCRRIRARSRVPIVVLAKQLSEAEKIEALDSGADAVVTRPYGMSELLARTRALLRRASGHEMSSLTCGAFRIDFRKRQVTIDDQVARLTPKELQVLAYLAHHPNRVVDRARLLEAAWGPSGPEHPEYLRVLVAQLRRKIERQPDRPQYLVTEAWVGYRFNPGLAPATSS